MENRVSEDIATGREPFSEADNVIELSEETVQEVEVYRNILETGINTKRPVMKGVTIQYMRNVLGSMLNGNVC